MVLSVVNKIIEGSLKQGQLPEYDNEVIKHSESFDKANKILPFPRNSRQYGILAL